jgi:hypothetical protein
MIFCASKITRSQKKPLWRKRGAKSEGKNPQKARFLAKNTENGQMVRFRFQQ